MRKLLDETEQQEAPDAALSINRFREVILQSPSLLAYQRQMFARYEERLRAALLEEIAPNDLRARLEAHVFAAGAIAVLRFQFEMGDVGQNESQRLFARGLRTLERGFFQWLPKRR